MDLDFRPLSLGELLDRAFSLYRAHFRTFVAIMAVPSGLAAGVGLLAEAAPEVASAIERSGQQPDLRVVMLLVGLVAALMLLVLLYFIAYMLAVGATTAAVSEAYLGRPTSAAAAFRRVGGRFWQLMLLMLLIALRIGGLFIAVGVIAVVVGAGMAVAAGQPSGAARVLFGLFVFGFLLLAGLGAIFMALRYSLAVAALVLEPIGAGQAIRRSIELTRGNLLRALALGVFATIIAYITILLFQGPFMTGAVLAGPDTTLALILNLVGALTGGVAGAISGPIMIVALALLYYDARIRQEGLDLQLMMQTLDGAPDAPLPPRPSTVVPG
ncbi:MAG TPA: hypothetical protein VLD67_00675 [Vicinamibacterales bacterium]|nr:hypothetical protein [Vicinamibacterales bacterium]